MGERSWINQLDHRARIRARMALDRQGNVISFTIQLEYWHREKWRPVIRYDSAHGQAHIDYLAPNGREYDKTWLGIFPPFNEAFTIAELELVNRYDEHIEQFLRKETAS
ncbi:MAG: hypothetical protein QM753_17605 [Thermomicrobiales bacterium]